MGSDIEMEKHRELVEAEERQIKEEKSLKTGGDRSRDTQPEAEDDPQRLEWAVESEKLYRMITSGWKITGIARVEYHRNPA